MYKKVLFLFFILVFVDYAYAATDSELEKSVQAQGKLLFDNQQQVSDLQSELNQLRGQLEETMHKLDQTIERQKIMLKQLSSSYSAKAADDLSYWSPTGNDKQDYDFILKFVSAGKQTSQAIDSLQQFLQNYPKSSYLANVNYWLGQLLYKQGKKSDASFYYATVVKSFPSSSKAAESLYKVGLILSERGERDKAKSVFQQIATKYPKDKSVIALANKKLAELN